MATVFLSYTHRDSSLAEKVQSALEENGHGVWRDVTRTDLAGQPVPSIIAGGLESSDFLLIIITKQALASRWMLQEVNSFMMDNTKWNRLIPMLFDDTPVEAFHGLLRSALSVDMRDFRRGMQRILDVLGPVGEVKTFASEQAGRERLFFAIDLALRCGNVVMRYYNSSILTNKTLDERRNAMTAADHAAQQEVESARLQHSVFKNDTFVGEEAPHNKTKPSATDFTWVVDPLDGTVNFENRIPFFCSAVGVLRDGDPYLGVVYAPVTNEVYFAINGSPSRVWDVARGEVSVISSDQETQDLKRCLVGTHISSRPKIASVLFEKNRLQEVGRRVRHLRALGCGQLALAYVASGRLQAFFQYGSYLWDQVAGVVLVMNSKGGEVMRLPSGRPWTNTARDFLAVANGAVGRELLKVLGSSRSRAGGKTDRSARERMGGPEASTESASPQGPGAGRGERRGARLRARAARR